MKKKYAFFVIAILIAVVAVSILVLHKSSSQQLRECPDEWIENRMPGPESDEARQYFIFKGQRKEIKNYEVDWIKSNCSVKVQHVY